jgi:hypothetical protein
MAAAAMAMTQPGRKTETAWVYLQPNVTRESAMELNVAQEKKPRREGRGESKCKKMHCLH